MDKRMFAFAAVAVMVICACAVCIEDSDVAGTTAPGSGSSSETKPEYSGTCGKGNPVPSWKYTTNDNVLEISGKGTVDSISNWKVNDSSTTATKLLTSFELKITTSGTDSISIGTVFAGKGVTKISSFGNIKSIPDGAFKGCTSLTDAALTGVTNIGKDAFNGTKLGSVSLSTTTATTIGTSAFENCKSLTSVTFGKITSVPDTAFKGCTALTTVNWGNDVASIGKSAFEGCSKLTTISFPNSIKTIPESAFKGCTSLTKIDFNKVTSVGSGAFENCSSLAEVDLKDVTSLNHNAFAGCNNLAKFTVSKTNTKYTAEDNVVYEIDSKKNKVSIYMNANKLSGTRTTVPDTVTKIHADYSSVVYMINITTYSKVEYVGETGARSICIFYCTQGIDGNSNAAYTNGKFTMSFKLYPGWDDDNCTVNGKHQDLTENRGTYSLSLTCKPGEFYKVLPIGIENVTKKMLLDQKTVNGTWNATFSLDAKTDANDIITTINSYTCMITGANGSNGTLQPTFTVLGVECKLVNVIKGDYSKLTTLKITGDVNIDKGVFMDIRGLRNVDIDGMKEIPRELFRGCVGMTSLTVDNCDRIYTYAFDGCVKLTSVNLGNTKHVDSDAFSGCRMDYILADSKSDLDSADGMFVIRTDDTKLTYSFVGDTLVIGNATGYSSITVTLSDKPTSVTVYKGGMAFVDISGRNHVTLTPVTGNNSSKCLVVFETAGGSSIASQEIDSGGKVKPISNPSWNGYTFKGWVKGNSTTPSNVDTTSAVTTSMIYSAVWEGSGSSSNVHIYAISAIAVAFITSIAILFIHRIK